MTLMHQQSPVDIFRPDNSLTIYCSYMLLALIRYASACLERASKINQKALQLVDKKMAIGIIISAVVPSVLWSCAMFFGDSATAKMPDFKLSNETKEIAVVQVLPDEQDNIAMIALKCAAVAQLVVTLILYIKIVYTSYNSQHSS